MLLVALRISRWLALGIVALSLANQCGCTTNPAGSAERIFELRLEAEPKQVRDVHSDIEFRLILTNVSNRSLLIGGWRMSIDDEIAVAAGRDPGLTTERARKLIRGELIVESFSLPLLVPRGQLRAGSSMDIFSMRDSLVGFRDSRLEPGPDPGNWYVVAAARIPRDLSDPSRKSGPNDFILMTDPLVIRVESEPVPKSE